MSNQQMVWAFRFAASIRNEKVDFDAAIEILETDMKSVGISKEDVELADRILSYGGKFELEHKLKLHKLGRLSKAS